MDFPLMNFNGNKENYLDTFGASAVENDNTSKNNTSRSQYNSSKILHDNTTDSLHHVAPTDAPLFASDVQHYGRSPHMSDCTEEQGIFNPGSTYGLPVSPKKRKIDKDGFVTPATPDIPKTSLFYGMEKHQLMYLDEKGDRIESPDKTDTNEDLFLDEQKRDPGEEERSRELIGDRHILQKVPAVPSDDQASSSNCKAIASGSAVQLLADLQDEAMNIFSQFSKTFQNSENFELSCLEKLDHMIAEARNLESHLQHQKTVLQQRSKALSVLLQQT